MKAYPRLFSEPLEFAFKKLPEEVWLNSYSQSLDYSQLKLRISLTSYDYDKISSVISSLTNTYSINLRADQGEPNRIVRNREKNMPVVFKEKTNRFGIPLYYAELSLVRKLIRGGV